MLRVFKILSSSQILYLDVEIEHNTFLYYIFLVLKISPFNPVFELDKFKQINSTKTKQKKLGFHNILLNRDGKYLGERS